MTSLTKRLKAQQGARPDRGSSLTLGKEMPSYRKSVLHEIRKQVVTHLPAFRPADFDVDVARKKDALFVADGRTKVFALWVHFSPKNPGDFTGELLVMSTAGKQDLPM